MEHNDRLEKDEARPFEEKMEEYETETEFWEEKQTQTDSLRDKAKEEDIDDLPF